MNEREMATNGDWFLRGKRNLVRVLGLVLEERDSAVCLEAGRHQWASRMKESDNEKKTHT